MNFRPSVVGLSPDGLQAALGEAPDAPLRARQICAWVYRRGAQSFQEMTDLPEGLRESLSREWEINPLRVLSRVEAPDGVIKLLVHSGDGEGFECVLLPSAGRVSCCLSTQVGCAMGCEFCATGLGGFDRNLTVTEIVAQYLVLQSLSKNRISHVSFMGMGEPLLNFENLMASIAILHDQVGISHRHITVSTVGIVPQMEKLGETGVPINVAVSLHSPFDEVRSELMPVNRKWSVGELMAASRRLVETTGRKITFEYLLIRDKTDSVQQADALASLVKGTPCLVNLIPFNAVRTEQKFRRPEPSRIRAFRERLESYGVNVTQRVERGHEIKAACGQLAGKHRGRYAKRRSQFSLRSEA